MRPLADTADITLTIDGGPPEQQVVADPQRLRQILLNLISNGVKYQRGPGGVWLSWQVERTDCSIRVRDNGPGIAESDHDRLFAPFDRLGAEATGIEGTGIGLTLSRGLAELMGGTVTVESAVGLGSTFVVTLPAVRAPIAPAAQQLPAATGEVATASGSPAVHTLVYIEDNVPNVKVMEAILKLRPNWRMLHAGLAAVGLDLARAHQPSLVLLDVHLPDGSGMDVLTALRADPAISRIPVVVLSADASQQQRHRLMAGGADRYLTKPLDLQVVLSVLDEAAKQPPRKPTEQ
jgi:CheY-like chemotaxis protein